jgi:metal-responsive CopG/Arc/MetJ family transcriptional regulator
MSRSKIAITLDDEVLAKVDDLVANRHFPSRSRAIEVAVAEKLQRLDQSRLARESAKLDASFEQLLAEEGLSEDVATWPEY